ncbi:DUF402 domain-containing protein [Candidatus Mycoplasma pogonae]
MKNQNVKVGSIISAQAYKYNGELYRQWNGIKVVENSQDHVVLHLDKTRVSKKNSQNWVIRELVIWFLPKNRMFNAIISIRNGQPYVYINLCSSFIFEDNTIKFIDYDLDIKCFPGEDFKIIDKSDFRKNRTKLKYPIRLVNKIYSTILDVLEMYLQDEYFFDHTYLKTYIKELSAKTKKNKSN